MPKIIKSYDLILSEPVVINLAPKIDPLMIEQESVTANEAIETFAEIDEENAYLTAQQELQQVKEQADQIIKETEQMIVEILERARSEANNIVLEARETAQEIKNQAVAEAESIKEEAREKGYQEGWEYAQKQNEEERNRVLLENEQLIQDAKRERDNIIKSSEEILLRLSIAIAKKYVEKEIEENPDIIINLVEKVIMQMADAEKTKILVSPQDFERLVKVELLAENGAEIELIPDSRIASGGCMADTDLGIIDARLETRMMNIDSALLDVLTRG